jgi:hypothetical protein
MHMKYWSEYLNNFTSINSAAGLFAFTAIFCSRLIALYLFQIPLNPYTGQRTSHKPQDIESVITIQYNMFQQKNVST